jgi:hypothetical protein
LTVFYQFIAFLSIDAVRAGHIGAEFCVVHRADAILLVFGGVTADITFCHVHYANCEYD